MPRAGPDRKCSWQAPLRPATVFSLGIQNPDLRTGVQATEPVQMNAQKQISSEAAKMNQIGTRLLDLRGGSRGFVTGLNHQDGAGRGEAFANERLAGATGGGASADDMSGRWGGFFNFGYNWGDVDQTTLQDGYDFNSYHLLAGVDYRVSDALVLGGAVSYSDTKSDYDLSLGNVKAKTWSFGGYGTYYRDAWFVDGLVAYGSTDYDTKRNIIISSSNPNIQPFNTSATASPGGTQWSASIGFGRNFDQEGFTITPTARLNYIWVKNKAFDENEPINGMGLHVDERTLNSLQSGLGVKLSTNVNTAYGVFGPYFQAQWMHEFHNGTPSIVSKFVFSPINQAFFIPTEDPTRNYAALMAGSSATFPNNFSGFVQFSAALGLKNESAYGIVAGIRKQF